MSSGKDGHYVNCLVQILSVDPTSTHAGAGILVDKDTIFTCTHVVEQAIGKSLPEDVSAILIPVRRYINGRYSAPKMAWLHKYNVLKRGVNAATDDIAVLKLKEDGFNIQEGDLPPFKIITETADLKITVSGFPIDAMHSGTEMVTAYYKLKSTFPNQWINAVIDEQNGDEIREGFSGGPVMEASSGAIIGMVCEADTYQHGIGRRGAKIIPIRNLLEVHKIRQAEITAHSLRQQVLMKQGSRFLLDKLSPGLHSFLSPRLQILKVPPELEIIHKYLRQTRARLSDRKIDKNYLPPPAKGLGDSGDPTIQTHKKQGNQFYLPFQQSIMEIAGVSSGGDSSNAQISVLNNKNKKVKNLVRSLIRSNKPIILLGEPGSGKTLALKQVAIQLCHINEKKVFPSACVFISLGRWVPVQNPTVADVEKLVIDNLSEELRPYLSQLIQQERLIVIFDGMDEMSREQYLKHTEALAFYAEENEKKVKTLFSCRITDFSPIFQHNRMVLMPFDEQHIRTYLEKRFKNTPLIISGELISIRGLARYLLTANLPIQPQNPFSLSLLCLYIQENLSYPKSRAELMEFSFEYQFNRKIKEDGIPVESIPGIKDYLLQWAQLAYEISLRNKGTDIIWNEDLEMIIRADVEDVIMRGRDCGVLELTTEQEPSRIRFIHHRAQEFFTAYYIVNSNITLDWTQYLDIPRWQETLLLIIQMKTDTAPLKELTIRLENVPADLQPAESTDVYKQKMKEAMLGQMVEFCSHIAKVIPYQHDSLFSLALTNAAVSLAACGNPVIQVKMLQVAGALPHFEMYEIVREACKSEIIWVRENAQIIASSLGGKVAGSGITEDTINAYGNGSILSSLPRRLRLAKQIRSRKTYLINVLAALLFIIQASIFASVVPIGSRIISHSANDISTVLEKYRPLAWEKDPAWPTYNKELNIIALLIVEWGPLITTCTALLLTLFSLIFAPRDSLWTLIERVLASSGGIILILYLWTSLVPGIDTQVPIDKTVSFILILFCILLVLVFLVSLVTPTLVLFISMLIWLVTTGVMAFLMYNWRKEIKYWGITYNRCWQEIKFGDFAKEIISNLALLLLGLLLIPIFTIWKDLSFVQEIAAAIPRLPLISRFSDFIVAFVTTAAIVSSLLILIIRLLFKNKRITDKLKETPMFVWLLLPFVCYIVLIVIEWTVIMLVSIFNFVVKLISSLYTPIKLSNTDLVNLIYIGIIMVGFWLLSMLLTGGQKVFSFAVRALAPKTFSTTSGFLMAIETAHAYRQAQLLSINSAQTLKISEEEFLQLLIKLEPYIKEEPAQSKYYSKIAQIQEHLRQSHIG